MAPQPIDLVELDSGQKDKPKMSQIALSDPTTPDESQQAVYIAKLMAGSSPFDAALAAGVSPLGVYLGRHADERFNQAVQIAEMAARDQLTAEVLQKAVVACGHLVELPVHGPDGEPVLDDNFEPVKRLHLVSNGSSPPILSKLVEKLIVSSDKPVSPVAIQVNQNNVNHGQSKDDWVLVTPREEDLPDGV